jgi:hypothetical protein
MHDTAIHIDALPGLRTVPSSVTAHKGIQYAVVEQEGDLRLAVLAPADHPVLATFEGATGAAGEHTLLVGPRSAANAVALRATLPWLRPMTLGLRTSAGLGDRLGLATPGHLQAVRAVGGRLAPIPAQQSIREMTRTGRSPQVVMDDAMWGVFMEGWQAGFGADADHLKNTTDIDNCLAAGYTFYTFDPGEHVDDLAETGSPAQVRERYESLPWDLLEDSPAALAARYLATPVQCEEHRIAFDQASLTRAAVKYGRAIAHVTTLYRHLERAAAGRAWEVEVSVDETEAPTSHVEHVYIATELRRLGVHWVSLAPRYIGRFEKGVDYIGDLAAFEADFAIHAAIARTLGPYKLSLHSGSDKFSIYAISARQTRGKVHLKTAGTSYLEALRTIAAFDAPFFRAIYRFARERYETDRASYHVSAQLDRAPGADDLPDSTLVTLLDQFDARQILHVTFGSVLTAHTPEGQKRFHDQFMALLRSHPDAYAANLKAHFIRHLTPFAEWSTDAQTAV